MQKSSPLGELFLLEPLTGFEPDLILTMDAPCGRISFSLQRRRSLLQSSRTSYATLLDASHSLQASLLRPPVFCGRAHPLFVISPVRLRSPSYAKKLPAWGALSLGAFNRIRTGDLILTMDALYLLSYKGVRLLERMTGIEPA